MKNYIGRREDLKAKINSHLSKLTGKEEDYFSKLKGKDLLALKTVLTDIHNVLTLEMTLKAIQWLGRYFSFSEQVTDEIIQEIDKIKPNTEGFDIKIDIPFKIIAELKCVVPINDGSQYGEAQWSGILRDAIKLRAGNKKISDTSQYYKFVFLLDLGEKTDIAIEKLLKESVSKSLDEKRALRHAIKKYTKLLEEPFSNNMELDKVYFVKLN